VALQLPEELGARPRPEKHTSTAVTARDVTPVPREAHLAGKAPVDVALERLLAVETEALGCCVRHDPVVQRLRAHVLAAWVHRHRRHRVHARLGDVLDLDVDAILPRSHRSVITGRDKAPVLVHERDGVDGLCVPRVVLHVVPGGHVVLHNASVLKAGKDHVRLVRIRVDADALRNGRCRETVQAFACFCVPQADDAVVPAARKLSAVMAEADVTHTFAVPVIRPHARAMRARNVPYLDFCVERRREEQVAVRRHDAYRRNALRVSAELHLELAGHEAPLGFHTAPVFWRLNP